METALGSEFFDWRSNPPEKVLLKFYLLHSNLAVCKIHEDNLAIAPASWQCYAMPPRRGRYMSIGVGLLSYPWMWYAKTRMQDKTEIQSSHLFYVQTNRPVGG